MPRVVGRPLTRATDDFSEVPDQRQRQEDRDGQHQARTGPVHATRLARRAGRTRVLTRVPIIRRPTQFGRDGTCRITLGCRPPSPLPIQSDPGIENNGYCQET